MNIHINEIYQIKMVCTKAFLYKMILLILTICMANSLTATPILADTNKYVNTATYAFNMAPYFNSANTVLNPYTYNAIYPTPYTDTTYHVGLSIQQMQYFIANRIMNYTCWVDDKSPGGVTILFYTNTANKIQTLVIYLMTISPGFQDYYFKEYWLPIGATLTNGDNYNITVWDGPYNNVGSVFVWSTLMGVDAKAGNGTNEIGLQLSVVLKSSGSLKITITAITSIPFWLTSVTVNYFVFNNGDLLANWQAKYTWGQFNGTNPANPLSAPNVWGYIRTYNTIVGITGFHIATDNFFQYQCNTSDPFSVSAISTNKWTLMTFEYIYLRFTYCADTTPFLMVATNLCYDICPIRYNSNTLDFQCIKCPTYDCYYCGNNGKCTQCNSTFDFRIMNNVTNRCIPLVGYYNNGVSQAVPCVVANCLTCTSAIFCLSCYSGKFLQGSICKNCIANCLNCTTTTNCQLCQPNYIFVSPSCILDCSSVVNCSTCSLTNATIQCVTCQIGYSLVNNTTCLTVCGDGMVMSPLQQCDDGTTTGLNGCSSNCTVQNTYFCVNSPSNCSSCLSFCTTCTNASVCITCFTNYTYSAGACTIDCTVISNCDTCNFTTNLNCLTCLTGFNLTSNNCSSVCGDGIFVSTEQCDDGNPTNLDGCSSTCTIQSGFFCTGAINTTSTCFACSPFCINCTNNISCNGCQTGYVVNSTNCTIDCSPITYCTTCNFSLGLTCTTCLVGYYPNGNSSPCLYTCGDGIRVTQQECDDGNLTINDGCSSTCTFEIGFFCIDVTINSGTANRSSCSSCMTNCYNCTNITICIQCNTAYVFNTTSSTCTIDCSSITYCATCNFTGTLNCLTCSIGYNLSGTACVSHCGDGIMTIEESCDDGNFVNNDGCSSSCVLELFFYCNNQTSNVSSTSNMSMCSPCLTNCQNCTIGTDCLACVVGYSYNLVGATVTCDTDCSIFSFCTTCIPGTCKTCLPYYLLDSSNNCQPICGDGIVLMIENCDDGNLKNGDGCSSSCTTESNFECSNGPLKPSLCSLLFFTITLDSIIKDENKNSIAIIYQLTPSTLPGYQTANWSQIIFQQSQLNVNFTSFSYDPTTGFLTVNADYGQNLNNQDLVVGFNFPPISPFELIPPNQTTTTKLVSSNNLSLQYYSDQSYAQARLLSMLARVLTCLALLLFLLGYVSAKLVGLELITIFQITFLSLVTLDNLSPSLNSLSFLSYSCGYNIHTLVNSTSLRIHSRFVPVQFSQSFINNYNLTIIVILLPLLIALVLALINRFAYSSEHPKLSKYSLLMRGEYVFYGLMFSAYSICVAAGIQVIYFINIAGMMYAGVALSAILLMSFIIYGVLFHKKPEIFGEFSQKFNKESIIQSHYYCFLLLQRIVTSLALLIFIIKPQSAIIMVLLVIQILVILCKKPYAGERGSLRPVLNLSITLTIQLIILLTPMFASIPSYEIYSPFVILVLLAITLLYNIYFFVKECRNKNNSNSRDQLQEEQNYMKNELSKFDTFQNSFMNAYNNLLNIQNHDGNAADDGSQPHSPGKLNTSNVSFVKKQLKQNERNGKERIQ